ncbi:hypothetical protein F6X86_03520 [Enterococcus durans]|uniref:Lipoprotein n=1 Tax=Enterococcus durans TaxID=53345 RepID=A0A5N0YUV5_9ENTE|nr:MULTISPECIES: hypothetical protein [Enterococcus]KAA9180247.1 hypothetical protein F6X86_03520 [Enterococcus durans]KAA9187373.1 hypothetical protein F6X85_04110 [Enterococcus durans]KAA9187542.1 hypothetical protein F6X90_04150 [Enterococcus durans]KAA9192296.1 hypothetical protein F6Y12_04405 [Enterococcus durans]KAA9194673.1 hypothetical protein F6X87_06060 [Enterococcus durans]
MKKSILLLLPIIFLISGCSQNDSTDATSSKKATNESTSSVETSSTDSSTSSTKQVTSSTKKESSISDTQSTTTTNSAEATTESTAQSSVAATDILAGYSDLQIEYARVWLATMGTQYKEWLTDPGFKLHVTKQPVGTPIDSYDQGSVTYPTETIMLSGEYGYQSLVVYSSNHNGTITRYNVPSHWQDPQMAQDPEYARSQTQNILDSAAVIPVPIGNPEDVKQLIDVLVINN